MLISFAAASATAGKADVFGLLAGCSVLTIIVTLLVLLISGVIAYEILSRPAPVLNDCVDANQQSEEVESGARRRRYKNGKKPQLGFEVPSTTYDVFTRGMKISGDGDCLGWRELDPTTDKLNDHFTWLSYSQVRQRAHNFGAGLVRTGLLTPGAAEASFLGICAKNSIEWVIAGEACSAFRLVIVPLYDTLGSAAITYVLNQARLSVMLVDNDVGVQNLLAAAANTASPSLKLIVHVKPISCDSEVAVQCRERGIKLMSYAEVEQGGADAPVTPVPAQPDDLYIICYTSGTTGDPKGVMITQRAVTAAVQMCLEAFLPRTVRPKEAVISYLPLAHMYEHLVHLFTFVSGCKLGMFSGNVLQLTQDLQILKPAMMPMVPRIMNRINQKTVSAVQGNLLAKTMLRLALYFKVREIKQGIYRKNSIWDFLVFRRLQNALGGKLHMLVVGSAPISGKVVDFTSAAFGLPILEGYGQTESGGAATCTVPQDDQPGQVGPPIGDVLIKLVDVPELDYNAERDGVGEILIKSPTAMSGYFRDEARTREAFDSENWLHTGDIGRWTARGALQIVDRKKHLFKLSQGEYVAPEKVENVLVQCRAVNTIFVDGDPLETYAVAIVAPDMEYVKSWAISQQQRSGAAGGRNYNDEELNRLCAESLPLRNDITAELLKFGKRNGLSSFEIPKRILLEPDAFTVENGLLTPTMKLKRPDVRKKYKSTLHDLYAEELPERSGAAIAAS